MILFRNDRSIPWMILAIAALIGCDRDSGLSEDLARHLERAGITLDPVEIHQSMWSRGGCVGAKYSPELALKIVESFKLQPISLGTAEERSLTLFLENKSDVKIAEWKEAWGAFGRPAEFRLQNGGQFDFFFLVVTNDGFMYLIAEYAYG